MSRFILALDKVNVAKQIANLINSGHQFYYKFYYWNILSSNITYIVEFDIHKVIGVIGLEQKNVNVTELKHLVVHPSYRNKGLGLNLLKAGVKYSVTPYVYGLVRSNNIVNIRNNIRIGMIPIGYCRGRGNYNMIIFARRTQNVSIEKCK